MGGVNLDYFVPKASRSLRPDHGPYTHLQHGKTVMPLVRRSNDWPFRMMTFRYGDVGLKC